MKQLVQNLKSGEMKILEVPLPVLNPNAVRVKVYYSLISAGTEGSKVSTARKNYLGKAKEKPEQVKQVIETLQKEGIVSTYRKVMNKLDSWTSLGYSCAGQVIEIGKDISNFKIGDFVACAGQDIANHAEVVTVPKKLCVKLPESVSFEDGAYNTVGAIALQGIRQADLKLGESCAVIGLGLLGQLTVQMLKASGIQVFGVDVDSYMVDKASASGADFAFERSTEGLEFTIINETSSSGVDAVIITAGTSSMDPIELAGRIVRKKGKVVVVGAVPTGFSRENYYKKELELLMSCSYGPGRYDPQYEEKGFDYPYSYVRWTENRNMGAFLNLIAQKKVNLKHLTTHVFDFDNAVDAYELIINKSEPYLGILFKYHPEREIKDKIVLQHNYKPSLVKIGFIGAGSFAQSFLLPNIHNFNHVTMVGVADSFGNNARTVAEKYEFSFASGKASDVIENQDINTVFIATPHHLHAELVIDALKRYKNVFVEKPLAMTPEQLDKIVDTYRKTATNNSHSPMLMVGFNRRFSPFIQKIKDIIKTAPVAINYRINAGFIPADHWTQDKEIGGGRIIGEVCHFVDLAMFLANSKPISVSAFCMDDKLHLNDNIVINLKFHNGSIAAISYLANGSKKLPKEYLEIYSNGLTVVLNDFKELIIFGNNRKRLKQLNQDKGHRQEIFSFLSAIEKGDGSPIPFDELYISSIMPFKIIESLRTGNTINVTNCTELLKSELIYDKQEVA